MAGKFLEKCTEIVRQQKMGYPYKITNTNTPIHRVYFWDEPLSTSGHIIPERWLLEQGGTWETLAKRGRSISPTEILMYVKDNDIAAISKDLWTLMSSSNPQKYKKYGYFEIPNFPIPFDAVIVKQAEWDKICKNDWHRLVDFLSLREVRFWKYREDFVLEAFKPMMMSVKEYSKTLNLKEESIRDLWAYINKDFILRLNTAIIYKDSDNKFHTYFPKDPNDSLITYNIDLMTEPVFDRVIQSPVLLKDTLNILKYDYSIPENQEVLNHTIHNAFIDTSFHCLNFNKVIFNGTITNNSDGPLLVKLNGGSDSVLYFRLPTRH